MDTKIETLVKVAEKYNVGLSHFLVNTIQKDDSTEGIGRFANQGIGEGTDVAIIGGLLVGEPDGMIAMPMGAGLYLNQAHMLFRATTNHSCNPNLRVSGFNKLVARRAIDKGEELTIDYGSISVGSGVTIIENCNCGSQNCRGEIKTDDYLKLPIDILAAYSRYMRETNVVY